MTTRAFRVSGRVQGVGFRWFVARLARSLALTGGVRNERDGSVVARVAAGDDEAVERFRSGLERGPAGSRVERVETLAADDGPWDLTF